MKSHLRSLVGCVFLPFTFKGNGTLPISDKPVFVRSIVYHSSAHCIFSIKEREGDISQQVMDRLAGRVRELYLEQPALPAIEFHSDEKYGIRLDKPSEIKVEFVEGSGLLECQLEVEELDG